jgi:hypothetical protein
MDEAFPGGPWDKSQRTRLSGQGLENKSRRTRCWRGGAVGKGSNHALPEIRGLGSPAQTTAISWSARVSAT